MVTRQSTPDQGTHLSKLKLHRIGSTIRDMVAGEVTPLHFTSYTGRVKLRFSVHTGLQCKVMFILLSSDGRPKDLSVELYPMV